MRDTRRPVRYECQLAIQWLVTGACGLPDSNDLSLGRQRRVLHRLT